MEKVELQELFLDRFGLAWGGPSVGQPYLPHWDGNFVLHFDIHLIERLTLSIIIGSFRIA